MENRTRCSASEAQGQPVETNSVISHKHKSIQMRKILNVGTSGVILKLRIIFSKTGRHWDFEHLTDT